ncbi:hypothetical protein D1007_19282 [Hordeum vulgare]|nr:hypothetical protein D1007_19282 [Hordeum vulgare]
MALSVWLFGVLYYVIYASMSDGYAAEPSYSGLIIAGVASVVSLAMTVCNMRQFGSANSHGAARRDEAGGGGEVRVTLFLHLEIVDHRRRAWDGDWIWEDGDANSAVVTTTSSGPAAVVDDPSRLTDRKKIPLTRDMVKKIFNVPSGRKPLEFNKRGEADFRKIYLEGERAPIPTTISVLPNADDDDEDTIDRTGILICLSLVLAPRTENMVPPEYLRSLQDMSVVHEFEWDEHIALDVMREVKKYHDNRNEGKLKFHIGGCLPMLPVIYMDHIDIPRGCIVDHTIDYSLPRACFVKELDFTAIIAVDTLEDGFGKRPFSRMQYSSTTPYATTKFLSSIEQLAQLPNKASVSATQITDMVGADGAQQPTEGSTNEVDSTTRNVHEPPPKITEGGDDVCGSLEDWLHPLPTFEELEHKDIHAAELKGALSSFGSLLEGIYRKRMGLMLSEASKAGFRSDEAKHECPDVTFAVPASPAPGMCNATASDSSPQQQKQLGCTTGTANATVTISSPQQPKQHQNMDVPQVESPPRLPVVDIESFMEIRARIPLFDDIFSAATSQGPIYDVTPLARIPPISTGPGVVLHHCEQDHWAVVVVNLMHKQFNVFDSNSQDSDYVSILEKPCSNLIENFKTLVRERNPWKHDLDTFERFSPSGYPEQSTKFDCSLFSILYMENLTANGLKPFNTDTTTLLNFRKYNRSKDFQTPTKHPQLGGGARKVAEKVLDSSL